MAVERVLSNLNLISFKTEGGLQNHIDELQDGDLVFTPDNSLKGNLFDFKWTDHKLNDISWLNADTFSWQSGDVYEAAYNHLAEDCKVYAWQYAPTQGGDIGYTTTETPAVGGVLMIGGNACNITEVGSDYVVAEHYKTGEARTYQRVAGSDSTAFVAGILSTETVDHITITFFRAKDGHKICSASQEENVRNLYDWMGVAWYYVFDVINKRFKLPRTKFGFTGLRDEVGKYVEAGLPNITGTNITMRKGTAGTGAIFSTGSPAQANFAGGSSDYLISGAFDASRSNTIYGNSDTVQPRATQMYLYFYVGNFERDALEQTAGITSEQLNNKADIDLFNAIYPVGSIYIGTQATCPMAIAIPNSTWELLEAGRALWTGNGSNGNTKIAAGLPNISGETSVADGYPNAIQYIRAVSASGAFYLSNRTMNCSKGAASANNSTASPIMFNASRSSSIYGNSTTVQPPAYVVNVWRRTA